MTAMGVDRFVITLRNSRLGKHEERHWSKEDAVRGMAWLKRMNARGFDVLIRPDGDHGLALLKGLSTTHIETLKKRGFGPAAVVDGSADCQAWVKLSEKPIAERIRELAGLGLYKGLGLSGGLTAEGTDGRLAGFTNRSLRTEREVHPYALLIESTGKRAAAASSYLEQMQRELFTGRSVSRSNRDVRGRGPSR